MLAGPNTATLVSPSETQVGCTASIQVPPATDGADAGITQSKERIVEPICPVIEGVVVRERYESYARLAEGATSGLARRVITLSTDAPLVVSGSPRLAVARSDERRESQTSLDSGEAESRGCRGATSPTASREASSLVSIGPTLTSQTFPQILSDLR